MKKINIGEFMYMVNLGGETAFTWGASKEEVLEDFAEVNNPVIENEVLVTEDNVGHFNFLFEFLGKVSEMISEEDQRIVLEEFFGLLKDIEKGVTTI